MDDVSGLADNSKSNFADFLTVSRKYRYNVIYAFHNIKTGKEVWSKIISQTTTFNIFPKSTLVTSVFRILQDNCSRKQLKYIPNRNLWIFRLYSDLANSSERFCLTFVQIIRTKMAQENIERVLKTLKNRFATTEIVKMTSCTRFLIVVG